ncbi:MAG: hypothetical protein ABIR68_19435 [Ilumatobacteraceae bacterium]
MAPASTKVQERSVQVTVVTSGQPTDRRGLAVSTPSAVSATAYGQGVELLIGSSAEAVSVLRVAVESDPHFELARVALACALAAAGMPEEALRCDCPPLSCRACTRRERQHIEVVRLVLSGERERAAVLGREHLREFPNDILVVYTLTSHGFA